MNFSTTYTSCFSKGCLKEIEVQVLTRSGLPRLDIIGLPEGMIKEGKDRIGACLHALGVNVNNKRILVSLNPGDIPKEGSHFDLPILVAILKSLGLYINHSHKDFYWGEVGLDGSIRSTQDYLAHVLYASSKKASTLVSGTPQNDIQFLYPHLPYQPAFIQSVADLVNLSDANKEKKLDKTELKPRLVDEELTKDWMEFENSILWKTLRGSADQFTLFALLAIGRHHLLIEGPPGVGKTTWCYALHEISPPLKNGEWASRFIFEPHKSERIGSLAELICPPLESPHHNSSTAAIIGGGSGNISAGAVTRAHKGILFMDEFAEFPRNVLEALREPLETKRVTIARSGATMQLSADIQLLAAMNPCKCGYHCSKKQCQCKTTEYTAYRSRISGPLKDRFHFKVLWDFHNFSQASDFEFQTMKRRIVQAKSFGTVQLNSIHLNTQMSPRNQRNYLEAFITWCRYFNLKSPSQRDQNNFEDFVGRLEG